MLFLVTTKCVHVLTAARAAVTVTASATAMSFEERLMMEVHACSEPEETTWFSLKRGSVAQRHAEKSAPRNREDANMRMRM